MRWGWWGRWRRPRGIVLACMGWLLNLSWATELAGGHFEVLKKKGVSNVKVYCPDALHAIVARHTGQFEAGDYSKGLQGAKFRILGKVGKISQGLGLGSEKPT